MSVEFLRKYLLTYLKQYPSLLQIKNFKHSQTKPGSLKNTFYSFNTFKNQEKNENRIIYFYKEQEKFFLNPFSLKNPLRQDPLIWEDFLKFSLQKFYFSILFEKQRFLKYYQELSFFDFLEKKQLSFGFPKASKSEQNSFSSKINHINFSFLTLTSKSYLNQSFSLNSKLPHKIETKRRNIKQEAFEFYNFEVCTQFEKIPLHLRYQTSLAEKVKQILKFKMFISVLFFFPLSFSSYFYSFTRSNEKQWTLIPKQFEEVLLKEMYIQFLEFCITHKSVEFKKFFNSRLFCSFLNLKRRFKPMNFLGSWQFPLLLNEINDSLLSISRIGIYSKNLLVKSWVSNNLQNSFQTPSKSLPIYLRNVFKFQTFTTLFLKEFSNFVDSASFEPLKIEKIIFNQFLRFSYLNHFDFSESKSSDPLELKTYLEKVRTRNFQSFAYSKLGVEGFPSILSSHSNVEFFWVHVGSALAFQRFLEYLKCLSIFPLTSVFNISFYSKSLEEIQHFKKISISSSHNSWNFFKTGELGQIDSFLKYYDIHFSKNLELKPIELLTSHYFKELKMIIKKSGSQSQLEVIKRLNPKIYLWCYRHRFLIFNPENYFGSIDKKVFELLWRWSCRRHGKKSKKWIREKYFHALENQGWVFGTYENASETSEFSEFVYVPSHRQLFENFRSSLMGKEKDFFF